MTNVNETLGLVPRWDASLRVYQSTCYLSLRDEECSVEKLQGLLPYTGIVVKGEGSLDTFRITFTPIYEKKQVALEVKRVLEGLGYTRVKIEL